MCNYLKNTVYKRTCFFESAHIQYTIDWRYTMQSYLLSNLLVPFILSALSDALFNQPLHLPRQWQLIPMLPYSSILHVLFNNQPRYNEYAEHHLFQNEKNLRPPYFFIDHRNSQRDQVDARHQNKHEMMTEYPDAQVRANKQDNNQRFIFSGSTLNNPFWKTATYTSVSTLNVTSLQNCIPSILFVIGSSTETCRRKKRETSSEELFQFPTDPSKPQQLMVTVLPSIDFSKRNGRQDQTTIVSSKDEVIPNEEWQERQDLDQEKRFFDYHHYVASTTVYSYVLSTFYSQRTFRPVAVNQQILCMPNGYVLCT